MKQNELITSEYLNNVYPYAISWIIEQHERVNQKYGNDMPYSLHLAMVASNAKKYMYLLPDKEDIFEEHIMQAAWGHDLIEDCRLTYNDVKEILGWQTADIIYAVTNGKGKNRAERASEQHYAEMRDCFGAVFIKLCDRIANASYSAATYSRMAEVYKKENDEFLRKIGFTKGDTHYKYYDMVLELNLIIASI